MAGAEELRCGCDIRGVGVSPSPLAVQWKVQGQGTVCALGDVTPREKGRGTAWQDGTGAKGMQRGCFNLPEDTAPAPGEHLCVPAEPWAVSTAAATPA